jgi:hypothetical protein
MDKYPHHIGVKYPFAESKKITATEIQYWNENPPEEIIASRERCNEAIGEMIRPMVERLYVICQKHGLVPELPSK